MSKTGRNGHCPCGSGKKYKRCCLTEDQGIVRLNGQHGLSDEHHEQLVASSNLVRALINRGRLDEAEIAANALIKRFPDLYDGYARLGLIHELRGNHRQAISSYRRVVALAREHPDPDQPAVPADYEAMIARLDRARVAG